MTRHRMGLLEKNQQNGLFLTESNWKKGTICYSLKRGILKIINLSNIAQQLKRNSNKFGRNWSIEFSPNIRTFFAQIHLINRQWKRINYKQSARWQHLSQLKASAFFSLQKNLVSCMKCNNLYSGLVTPSSGWWSPINPNFRRPVL